MTTLESLNTVTTVATVSQSLDRNQCGGASNERHNMRLVVDILKEKSDKELLALIETLTDDIPTLQPDEFGDTFMIEMYKETLRKAKAEAESRGLTHGE